MMSYSKTSPKRLCIRACLKISNVDRAEKNTDIYQKRFLVKKGDAMLAGHSFREIRHSNEVLGKGNGPQSNLFKDSGTRNRWRNGWLQNVSLTCGWPDGLDPRLLQLGQIQVLVIVTSDGYRTQW